MSVATKTRLMSLIASGMAREIFSHSEQGDFDVTGMREAAERALYHDKCEIVNIDLSQLLGHIMESRVTEPERVMSLPESAWQDDPGLIIYYPEDNSHLMIDGHHRAMRRNVEGKTTMMFYLLQPKDIIRPDYSRPHFRPDWGSKIVDPATGKIRERVGGEHG